MDSGMLSRRYAEALFRYASAHGAEQQVYAEVSTLVASFTRYPALRRVLDNRLLPIEKKAEVIARCSGGGTDDKLSPAISEQFSHFIRLVLDERREEFLQMICLSYIQLVRRERGVMDVEVTTAAKVDESTREVLKNELVRRTGKTVTMHLHTDPTLIGGYVFRWDTFRFDASARTALRRIKKTLTQIKL